MATITIEVTDLVQRITAYQDEHGLSDRELGMRLGVSKNSPHNWRSGRAMHLTRELQENIADALGIGVIDVLDLHGFAVTDDPDDVTASVAASGPYLRSVPVVSGNVILMPGLDDPDLAAPEGCAECAAMDLRALVAAS